MSDYIPDIPSVDDIARAVTRAISDLLGDLLDRPLDTVDNVVDRISATVNNAIDSASHNVDTAIGVAGRSVDNAINSAKSIADTAVTAASNAVNKALDNATTAVNNAVGVASKAVDQAIAGGTAIANRSIDAAERVANTAIGSAAGSVDKAINNATNIAQNAIGSARAVAESAIDVADRRIGQVISSAKEAIVTVSGDIKTGIENAGKAFERGVTGAVNAVGGLVTGAIDSAERAVNKAITNASTAVGTAINRASDFINLIAGTISAGINTSLAQLGAQWDALMNSIAVWWQNTITYIEDLIRRVNAYITENFTKAWNWITEAAADYGENVQNNLASLESGITAIGSKLFSCGYSSYTQVIGDISSLGLDNSLVRVLVYGILGAGMVLAGAPTAAHPYLQCIANIGMQEVRPMSADLGTLASAIVRGKPSGGAFGEAAGRLGVPDGHAQAYIETAQNAVPVGTIIESLIRGFIDRPTAEGQLVDASYNPAFLEQFISTSLPLIGPIEALTAARRGGWANESALAELGKAGYSSEQTAALSRLTDQLLTFDEYVTAWLREHIDEPTLDGLLAQRGYAPVESNLLKQLAFYIPPPSDLIRMSLKDVWNKEIVDTFGLNEDLPEEFIKYARQQGISEFWAIKYWNMAWDYPSNTQGFDMYQRGIIDLKELKLLLKTNDVPPFWRERMLELAYNPLTRVDVRRMYQLGVLTEDQITRAYLDIGYSPENAAHLTEFTKRYVAEAEANNQSKVKELSRAQIEQAYLGGLFTKQEALDALIQLNYRKEDAELMLQLAVVRTATDANDSRYKSHLDRTIKSVIGAYSASIVNESAARDLLEDLGLTPNEINREFALTRWENDLRFKADAIDQIGKLYTQYTIDWDKAKSMLSDLGLLQAEISQHFMLWSLERELRGDKPTRADLRRWYKNNLINDVTYADELRGLGYAEQYVNLYVFEDT